MKKRSSPSLDAPQPLDPAVFHAALLKWYKRHARDLPWRGVDDPYATWLSEIMLQQTRVATVIERYQEFLLRFPTIRALAEANEDDVLALWSGLGYYRRARMLHRAAQFVTRELKGKLPRTAEELRTLPGVGDYTSAAIASIAYGESVAVVDGNVERVLLRVLGRPEDKGAATRALIQETAQSLIPPQPVRRTRANPCGDHNQAMMELGATICTPRSPLCLQCPVLELCQTRGEHITGERTQMQSRTVAHLLVRRRRGTREEVLLSRRPEDASLMPNMLELPPLPIDAVEGLEPVLRVRHSITNTNYYVMIFAERIAGLPPQTEDLSDEIALVTDETVTHAVSDLSKLDPEDIPFVAETPGEDDELSLLSAIPTAQTDMFWFPATRLPALAITGLTRKVLQRLGVMQIPKPVRRVP
ncbi:A/G-specific DNA-adenine glycosylase [Bryocella elongata]|uniref:Adenine DNA glycosylase n=1 Tax=Bryocella elongata TaxID=863522 RepID=A0A1H5Y9Q8_9BACT|nr:A/G-specific adenine glycosylase [Bryocella elongata]SEG20505.1 A/G-specific DNA-adenine glycosylase [Bryocella elongata]